MRTGYDKHLLKYTGSCPALSTWFMYLWKLGNLGIGKKWAARLYWEQSSAFSTGLLLYIAWNITLETESTPGLNCQFWLSQWIYIILSYVIIYFICVLYCIRIRVRGGIYGKIWTEPEGNISGFSLWPGLSWQWCWADRRANMCNASKMTK